MKNRTSILFISAIIGTATALSARESAFSRSRPSSPEKGSSSVRSSDASLYSGRTPSRESAPTSIRTSGVRPSYSASESAPPSNVRSSPMPSRPTPTVQSATPRRVTSAPSPSYTSSAERPASSRVFGGSSTARSTTYAPSSVNGSGRDSRGSGPFTKQEPPARSVACLLYTSPSPRD